MRGGTYLVTWEIQVDAGSPIEAARIAEELHQVTPDPESLCRVYTVRLDDPSADRKRSKRGGVTIDLSINGDW